MSELICAECCCEFINMAYMSMIIESQSNTSLRDISDALQAVRDGKKVQSSSGYIYWASQLIPCAVGPMFVGNTRYI